jgi:hypothetical protein
MRSQKADKIASDAFLPVPEGVRIRYQHYYIRSVRDRIVVGKFGEARVGPPQLVGTAAWLVDDKGEEIDGTRCISRVHENDTAIKKLGRLKAHNRCIKTYQKAKE